MNIEKFNEMIKEGKYELEDFKYQNMPFTRWNHILRAKESGRLFLTIRLSDDEIGFIEVFTGESD